MATGWMRENRKIVLAVLVVVLMVAWGAIPALRYLMVDGGRTYGTIRGEQIGPTQMRKAGRELNKLRQAGVLRPDKGIGGFIFGGESKAGGTDAAWRYLVLLHEARSAEIHVMPGEYQGLFAPQGPLPTGDSTLRDGIINLIKISKLMAFQRGTTYVSTAEQWMDYNYKQYELDLNLVQIDPTVFRSQVEVTPDEIRDFYEAHKNIRPDTKGGRVGYKAPPRAKMEYAIASVEECKKLVDVSEGEIKKYYQEHKGEYEIKKEKGETAEETKDDSPGENDGEAKESEENENNENPRYKPLKEVREQIKETLVENKAEKLAREKVEKALEDLDATTAQFMNEPHPVQQMAKRYDCQYVVPVTDGGRKYLSRKEMKKQVPGGSKVVKRVFDQAIEINYYSFLETPEGPMIVQVLDRKKAQPEPFEEVREKVEDDLRREKALNRARTVADNLVARVRETSLDAAVKTMNEQLLAELGPLPANGKNENGAQPDDEKGSEKPDEAAARKNYLQVKNTGYIPRTQAVIQAVGARCPNVLEKATLMETGALKAVVERARGEMAVYVVEKNGARNPSAAGFWPWKQRRRLMTLFTAPRKKTQRWLDGLMKRFPLPTTEK